MAQTIYLETKDNKVKFYLDPDSLTDSNIDKNFECSDNQISNYVRIIYKVPNSNYNCGNSQFHKYKADSGSIVRDKNGICKKIAYPAGTVILATRHIKASGERYFTTDAGIVDIKKNEILEDILNDKFIKTNKDLPEQLVEKKKIVDNISTKPCVSKDLDWLDNIVIIILLIMVAWLLGKQGLPHIYKVDYKK